MITSQHIVLFIVYFAILHYIFEPRDDNMKGLLYFKQLFDERCQVNALTTRNIRGLSYLNYFETLYHRFNNANVTACKAIDLSIPGKPSAPLIAGMSHLYTENSTTKYFIKSPLVNELLIESILIKGQLNGFSALVSMDQLWIYIPLVLFIMYPSLHDSTVSCYRSIKDYLFDGESTRINNNVYIHESTTGANTAPEANNALGEPSTTSRRSSAASSAGTIHLDYTNTAAHNMTPAQFLTEEAKDAGPPKKRDEIPFELTKSQKFWSDTPPDQSDPFTMSDHSSNSIRNDQDGHGFQFPTAPGGLGNGNNNSIAQGTATGRPTTAADPNPPKSGLKITPLSDSSFLLDSDFSDMSFVPPTGSVSEKFPEFAEDNTSKLTLSKPLAAGGPSKATDTPSSSKPVEPGGPSKPFGVLTASRPAPVAGPSKPIPTAGPSKPTVIHKHSDASKPSKAAQITGHSNAPAPFEKKDSPPFDGHITSLQHPKFARRPFSHADELARFAAEKQTANDFADQMGAFLKRIQVGEIPKSNTTAGGSKQPPFTVGFKPPTSHKDATRHTQHLTEQPLKKTPFKGDTALTRAQQGEPSQKKKTSSQKADKPNLPQQQPSNIRVDAPSPAELPVNSAKIASSLTEVTANAPFMPRKKIQSKAAPSTVKLSFSQFKTDADDSPTDASNVTDPPSLPQKQPAAYVVPDPSAAAISPFSSSSNDKKNPDSPKPSLSPKLKLAYSPGSLRSLTHKTTQVKRAPVFKSSFQHLRGPSGIHTLADASTRRNRGTPTGASETPMNTISFGTPRAFDFGDTKTPTSSASSGTPLYTSISLAANAEPSNPSQRYGASSGDTASNPDRAPAPPVDTSYPAGKQDAGADKEVSSLLGSQSSEFKEAHPPEGLLQSLKKKAKEQTSQQTNQQVFQQAYQPGKPKIKGKGKKKKGKKRR